MPSTQTDGKSDNGLTFGEVPEPPARTGRTPEKVMDEATADSIVAAIDSGKWVSDGKDYGSKPACAKQIQWIRKELLRLKKIADSKDIRSRTYQSPDDEKKFRYAIARKSDDNGSSDE